MGFDGETHDGMPVAAELGANAAIGSRPVGTQPNQVRMAALARRMGSQVLKL